MSGVFYRILWKARHFLYNLDILLTSMTVTIESPILQSLETETATSRALDTARTAADPQY